MAGKKSNSFRNSADDFQAEEKESKKPLKGGRMAWIKDERTLRIIGAFFILFSLFLFLSFTSHIINLWSFETDQDLLQSSNWQWYKTNNPKGSANLMGYLGAWFGHLFIHKWFGVASFIILFSVFTFGTKLLFNWQMYPIGKILRYTFFIVVWVSLLMGFIFHSQNLFMGGGFGYFGFLWFKSLFGSIGMVLFLLLYAAVFMIAVYNVDFRFKMSDLVQDMPSEDSKGIAVPFSEHELEAEAIKTHYVEQTDDLDVNLDDILATEIEDEAEGIDLITLNNSDEVEAEIIESTVDAPSAPISFTVDNVRPKKAEAPKDF
jgi:S-DNA-T family DNA segregation ATPase FtsK/SpoIIIE